MNQILLRALDFNKYYQTIIRMIYHFTVLRVVYLIRVERWRPSDTSVLDSSFDSHKEVDVAVVLLIAEVNVVLHVNPG
jgi:hypothetical protein